MLAEPNVSWYYTDSTYETITDGLNVTFTVHPSHRDIVLNVVRADRPFYELKAIGVEDVRVLDFPGCDVFEISLSKKEGLRIQLRPYFRITHGFEQLPPWTGVADV